MTNTGEAIRVIATPQQPATTTRLPSLTALCLEDCLFTQLGDVPWLDSLLSSFPNLLYLRIQCPLNGTPQAEDADRLPFVIPTDEDGGCVLKDITLPATLRHLDLSTVHAIFSPANISRIHGSLRSLRYVAGVTNEALLALRDCETLTFLELNYWNGGDERTDGAFLSLIGTLPCLKALDVCGPPLDVVAQLPELCPSLEHLRFHSCLWQGTNFQAVHALARMKQLSSLHLGVSEGLRNGLEQIECLGPLLEARKEWLEHLVLESVYGLPGEGIGTSRGTYLYVLEGE